MSIYQKICESSKERHTVAIIQWLRKEIMKSCQKVCPRFYGKIKSFTSLYSTLQQQELNCLGAGVDYLFLKKNISLYIKDIYRAEVTLGT